jgi:hypothetical protein
VGPSGVRLPGGAHRVPTNQSSLLASGTPVHEPECKGFAFGHVVPGMFVPTGAVQEACASYQRTREQLSAIELQAGETLGISPVN